MIAYRTSVTGGNNNTNATITVPATCQVGDVFIVHLSLNNTDNINSEPAGLVLLDNNTTASSQYPNRLYYGVVDGTTISAGTVLSWPLAATRSWTLNLYAASGVNTKAPVRGLWTLGAITTTLKFNFGFPVASSWMLEVGSAKSNGTSITSFSTTAAWTTRSTATANTTTFQGASFIADYNAGLAPAGTYGGETYTPSSTPGAWVSYVLALNPDPVGGTSQTPSASWLYTKIPASIMTGTGYSTAANSTNSSTVTVNKPTSLADGDYMLMCCAHQLTGATVTPPSGWTLLTSANTQGNQFIYYKYVPSAAAETASNYTWTISGAGRYTADLVTVRNADPTYFLDGSGTIQYTGGTTAVDASITPTSNNTLLVAFNFNYMTSTAVSTITAPSGFTQATQQNSPTSTNTTDSQIAFQVLPASGATGTQTFTMSTSASVTGGVLFAIRQHQ